MGITVLVEPNFNGHRFQAVANVARVARTRGGVVLLTSSGSAGTPNFANFLGGVDLEVEECFTGIYPAASDIAFVVADLCRTREVDRVLVMDADQTLKRWWYVAPSVFRDLPRRPRIAFMITRAPTRVSLTDWRGWWLRTAKTLLVLLARSTGALHHAAGFAGRDDTARGWVIRRARDPDICTAHSRDREAIRQSYGLPADRRIVGIYGGITAGKNPVLVWQGLQERHIDADLLLAGSLTADVEEWVRTVAPSRHGRIIVREGFLPDHELDSLVAAADVVPLAMAHNAPSGIMGKALAAGVPVVTAGSKVRARELLATDAGELAELTSGSLGAAIERVLARDPSVPRHNSVPPATPEEFARILLGL